MGVSVTIVPEVLSWAVERSGRSIEEFERGDLRVSDWLSGAKQPTLTQMEQFARRTGVPVGMLLLPQRPRFTLPVPDFRAGIRGKLAEPSADLAAVLRMSQQRQGWFIDHAEANGLPPAEMVGVAVDWSVERTAADMRRRLHFEVVDRPQRDRIRKHLVRAFEELGGLCVVTSMVGNNNHRMLDVGEFRGFTLVDWLAPLVFVNANQTSNGQLFTLAHEFAHVWRGSSGIGNEQEPDAAGSDPIEQWCNQVAAEFLVPSKDLEKVWVEYRDLPLRELLDRLTGRYRCGTVVVLLAIHRLGLIRFTDIDAEYRRELEWLASRERTASKEGGSYYHGLPLKIGERFSKALVQDTLEGRTEFAQALRLLSMNRTATFDRYAEHLKVS